MRYVEKNLAIILIVLVALVLIGLAIWFFEKRIARIERRMKPGTAYLQPTIQRKILRPNIPKNAYKF